MGASRLVDGIDERVNGFLSRPIEGKWPYLWIDATSLKLRQGGRIVSIAVIFAQETADDASRQWRHVADRLRDGFAKLAEFMERTEADILAYMGFPKEHWTQISSTNPIERVNREIKRRCDVIGIFPNDAAVIRLVGALMLEHNDEWAVCRRYMTLGSLAALSHNHTITLPVMVA